MSSDSDEFYDIDDQDVTAENTILSNDPENG